MSREGRLRLRTSGLEVAYVEHGPAPSAAAPKILALHGWLDNAASFTALAAAWPEVSMVAVDLPGHGKSEHRPKGQPYHFIDWVADVVDILDALEWERAILLGHSMGAGAAALTAASAPARVAALLLVEGLGPLSSDDDAAPGRVADYLNERRAFADRQPPRYPSLEVMRQRAMGAVPGLEASHADALLERGARALADGFTWSADARLRHTSPLRLSEGQVRAFLRQIVCPALVVRAEPGIPADIVMLEGRLECVAGHRLVRLPGPHHVHMTDPVAVAALLKTFVVELRKAAV